MPEYPEIYTLAAQMREHLAGRRISELHCSNEKCLNKPLPAFEQAVQGAVISTSAGRGKWIRIPLQAQAGTLWLNLNMGGNVVLRAADDPPLPKSRLSLCFADGAALDIAFWFLGYLHHVEKGAAHSQTDRLGTDPLAPDFTPQRFDALLGQRKQAIKTLLLRQDVIAGIGNYYVQDMLFTARIHPLTPTVQLDTVARTRLYHAMRDILSRSLACGGADYEYDLFNRPGGFGKDMLVAYKPGQPCPTCGTTIEKIKTGATSTHICPACQTL